MTAATPANEARHLIELCESYQYAQLIKEPKRVTSSSKSLIDLGLTNEPDKFVSYIRRVSYWLQRSQFNLRLYALGRSRKSLNRDNTKILCLMTMNDMALVPCDKIEQVDNPIREWEMWKQSFLVVRS